MVKSREYPTFACRNCGSPYQAFPPESGLSYAFRKPCEEDHNVKQDYRCERCNHNNTLYWCPGHVYVE